MMRLRALVPAVVALVLVVTGCVSHAFAATASYDVTVDATVFNDTSIPDLDAPAVSTVTGVTPTLTAFYRSPDPDTGTLQFEVCLESACSNVVRSGSSSSGLAPDAPGDWTVPLALTMGSYHWRARSIDQYGEASGWTAAREILINNDFDMPTSVPVIREGVNGGEQWYVVGSNPALTYINPTYSGTFWVRANAADVTSGVKEVQFPPAGQPGWTPSALPSPVTVAPYEQLYTWTPGDAPLGVKTFVVTDNSPAANTSTGQFEVLWDNTEPTGGSLTVPDIVTNAANESIAFTVGTDSESGIFKRRLWRAESAFHDGICDAPGAFTGVGDPMNEPSPYTDSDLDDGTCYAYELRVNDNVNNVQTIPSASRVRVDTTAPTGSISASPTGPVGGNVTLSGSITDAASRPSSVAITYSGPASGSCTGASLGAPANTRGWTCTFPVGTLSLPDGTYTITLNGLDGAGNAIAPAEERTIVVDRNPPVVNSLTITEQIDPDYQHPVNCPLPCTPKLYYNPTHGGSFDVEIDGSDLGTGVYDATFVDFDGPGLVWSYISAVRPGPTPIRQTYTFTAGAFASGSHNVVLWDVAGNNASQLMQLAPDTSPPTVGGVATLPAYRSVLSVPVTFNASSDGTGSGVSASRSYVERGTYSDLDCTALVSIDTVTLVGGADTSVSDGFCYRYRYVAVDNVGNENSHPMSPQSVVVDTTAPTGTIDALPAGPITDSANFTGTIDDAWTEPQNIYVNFNNGTDSVNACNGGPVLGTGPARTWSCWFNPNGLSEGTYTITLTGNDHAGNALAPVTRTVVVDHAMPMFTDVRFSEVSGVQFTHPVACAYPCTPQLFVNPAGTGEVDLTVTGTDAATGTSSATFPDFDGAATAWLPAGSVVGGTSPYTQRYSFTGPGVTSAVSGPIFLWDAAGNQRPASVNVTIDGTDPTPGTVSGPPAYRNALSVPVAFTLGSDAGGSGVDAALTTLQREDGTLLGDTCDFTGSVWAPVTLVVGNDTSVAHGNCYRYRVHTVDNVGNFANSGVSSTVRVDTAAPTGAIALTPADPWRGTIAVTGTSGDAATSVQGVTLSYTGAGTGTPCSAMASALWASPGCSLNTVAMASGSYVLTATISDRAGNTFAATRNVTVDNSPPNVGVPTFAELSGGQYQHLAAGGTLWVNPLGSGTMRMTTVATDTPSGMATVGFPTLGANWLPASGLGTPGAGDTYTYDYTFTAPVLLDAGPFQLTGTDNAGNPSSRAFNVDLDATLPAGGSISYPTSGAVPQVTFNTGADPQSGIREWFLERRSTATLTSTTCDTTTWGGWGIIGLTTPASPMPDNTVAPSTCYQYRLAVIDNVDNRREYLAANTFITPTSRVVVMPTATTTSVTERGAAATWTVALTAAPSSATRIDLTGAGSTLSLSANSLTFDALDWYLPKTITVTAVDDDVDTTPDSVTMQVAHRATSGDPTYTALAPVSVPVTVVDDDKAGITVDQSSIAVNEPATSTGFGVRLNTRPVGTITVSLGTGSSQTSVAPTTMTFDASSWSTLQTATVTAVDDPDVDGAQAASVTLTGSSSNVSDAAYSGVTGSPVAVSVADDDTAGVIIDTAAVARVSERSAETDTSVAVRLAARPAGDVRVAPTVADGELRSPTGTLTFTRNNWSTAQSVRIVAFDDPIAEATPHIGRMVFKTTSTDAAWGSITDKPVAVEIADDDPARLVQTPGSGWTLSKDVLELREDATSSAVVSIAADGDPTRTIRIEPIVTSDADVKVTPHVAVIDPDAPNSSKSFTVSAVDDGVNEDSTESVRLTWKVTTVDPLYDGKGIASTNLTVIDRATTTNSPPTDPGPTGGGDTSDPTPTGGGGGGTPDPDGPGPQPGPGGDTDGDPGPGTTVGDDSTTTTATGPTATPTPNRHRPNAHGDGGVTKGVTKFAKKHPVVTSGIATGALAAGAAIAKPLLVGGKLIGSLAPGGGGGMGHVHGLGQLRRLLRRKKQQGALGRLLSLLRRRKRRGDDEQDPLSSMSGVEYDEWRRVGRDWRDLFDPDRNSW